ncbi:threonine-phosphate decarboxylase [Phormidium sp. CLA17]|uniref:threonine-phosphate decarboxylase CobD n=1 Tax=Leptolyngbya sp. Cla-17 TaxID=2803751 RepID=UPI0014917AA7|nr:threonine-phosphate decarboxylase CobD [Leptolyngbya sp. Cla-17]MBM0741860.1 threonine-phosphate decarboxylase [Leptolyngbya sp. Cla-17]
MPTYRPSHGGNLVWAASLANSSPDAILDFSASINPLGPPPSAIAAIQAALEDLNAYPDPTYSQLCRAISDFHQISPEWILPGNGSAELLTWAGRELAELDATHLLTPAFSDYRRALTAFGATVEERPLKIFRVTNSDLTASSKELCPISTIHPSSIINRLGLLLNNPHNPTGQLFARDEIIPYLDSFELVVVDEAFMDFLPPGEEQSMIDWVQKYPNLVVLRSLTKFYSLPGLRLGYAIAHPNRIQRWQRWRDPWSVNSLAAAVGSVVLQDTAFQQQTWDWLAATRPKFQQQLASISGLQPLSSTTNFLLVHSDRSVPDLQANLLKRDQILIRDCMSFPELGDRYFRVAIRTAEENQRLIDALNKELGAKS